VQEYITHRTIMEKVIVPALHRMKREGHLPQIAPQ
jgi:hypothetical protein